MISMSKKNLTELYPDYYSASGNPEMINIGKMYFVSMLAKGSFTDGIFYQRIAVLQQVVQKISDVFKGSDQFFESLVLEGLYWNDNKYGEHTISQVFDAGPLSELNYRLMIRVPEYVTEEHLSGAIKHLPIEQKEIAKSLGLFEYEEGRCVQMLHVGPFINEYQTLGQLEEYAGVNQLQKGGIHHEIYLVDFTKGGSQDHLKTILREPVKGIVK